MPPIESIIAVIFAGFALSLTPGPSMLYVLSRSIGQSRAAGLASAIGLGLGGVILAIVTALGLGVLLAQFDWLVSTLKYVGAVYLVWLGYGLIREAHEAAQVTLEAEKQTERPFSTIVWQGVLVEFLNPKTVLFFALFLPPFVGANTISTGDSNLQTQLLILGALVPLTALPSDLMVAYFGGSMRNAINRHRFLRECLGWIGGIMLIIVAMNLVWGFF